MSEPHEIRFRAITEHMQANLSELDATGVTVDLRPYAEHYLPPAEHGDASPPLHLALAHWQKTGNRDLLIARQLQLERQQIALSALAFIHGYITARGEQHVYLSHNPITDMQMKEQYLQSSHVKKAVSPHFGTGQEVRPVRTVTIKFPHTERDKYVGVTTLSDSISDEVRRNVAACLGLSKASRKGAKINPSFEEFDPTLRLGLTPGIIGPFLTSAQANTVDGWFYDGSLETPDQPVEIALDYWNSLIVRKVAFEDIMRSYTDWFVKPGFITTIIE